MHERIDVEHDDQTADARMRGRAAEPAGAGTEAPVEPPAPQGGLAGAPPQTGGALPSETEGVEDRSRALGEAQAKAAAAEGRAAEVHDRWLRSQAEIDNVRKRTARELAEGLKYANERLVKELLPVLDNLERALVAVDAAAGTGEGTAALRDGVSLTHAQLLGVLTKFGVEPIEALGRPFDPGVHEAIQHVESDQPAGTVVAEYQRGYLLNGRLVRPAMVGVAASRADGGGPAA